MRTFLWVVLLFDQLFLLVVGSADLKKYELTDFQLKAQLEGKTDKNSQLLRRLHKNLGYVNRQQQLELLLAFSVGVTLFTNLISPVLVGLLWCLLCTLIIVIVKRSELIKKYSYQLFESMLDIIVKVATWFRPLWWLTGLPQKANRILPTSQEELKTIISDSTVISKEERERLLIILESDTKTAKDIMTLGRKVTHVTPSATLGPVLLADLEKGGHRYFPVFTKTEGVVGMLNLRAVTDVGSAKGYAKVGDIMEEDLVWVPDDMPVFEVARMFLTAKQYVLLVQNEDLEFAGIITIADLLKHTIAIVKDV